MSDVAPLSRQNTAFLQPRLAVLGQESASPLYAVGAPRIVHTSTLALFCSSKTPASLILQIHDLAQHWRVDGPTIISGFHSPAEREALTVLLRGPQPAIVCPARSLVRMRIQAKYKTPLAEGRLLLLSPFPDTVRRATQAIAYRRNRFVAALADRVLIAHAHPGSKTAQLAREIAAWGRPVVTLAHPANAHLHLPAFEGE